MGIILNSRLEGAITEGVKKLSFTAENGFFEENVAGYPKFSQETRFK